MTEHEMIVSDSIFKQFIRKIDFPRSSGLWYITINRSIRCHHLSNIALRLLPLRRLRSAVHFGTRYDLREGRPGPLSAQ
jgi:hypothetical protein